jgi:hypothetical protein
VSQAAARSASARRRLRDRGWRIRRSLQRRHIDSGRYDLVDPIEKLVAQHDLGAEQAIELLHGAGADDGGGERRVRHHERKRHVHQRHSGALR